MNEADRGRFLPRGRRKIEVTKSEDAFTCLIDAPQRRDELASREDVGRVEALNAGVARVTVAEGDDLARRRDAAMDDLRRAGRVVHHEYRDTAEPDATYRITDEIIVRFVDGTNAELIARILDDHGVVIKKHYRELGPAYLVVVTDEANANPVKVANALEDLDEVDYAEPSVVNEIARFALPTDELFPDQWHLRATPAPDIVSSADASVVGAWTVTMGTRDVVVAVLDDGFELSHPDFAGPGKVVEPVDFQGGDDDPLPEHGDYHGTPCAGVAIAEANGQGCVGVAPGCAFMPVRFPLSANDPWLIEIFRYISQRAHVASCSWGMVPGNYPLHAAVADTFSDLVRTGGKDGRGLSIVFAAGNYNAPVDDTVDYTIRWGSSQGVREATGRIVNGFAAHPDTITVSAVTSLGRKSLYSNHGQGITVAAPSNNFHPVTYGRLAGRGITTTDNEYHGSDFTPGKRYTNSFGGTSSATPLVAGVAALVRSANPELTALEVTEILETTADKITDHSTDPLYGHAEGTYTDGYSLWFGFGKVSAERAVAEASHRRAPADTVERNWTGRLAVPDAYPPGVTSVLEVPSEAYIVAAEVELTLEHTWIGDLRIELTSPAGTTVLLHDRSGGNTRDLHRRYTVHDTPALSALVAEPAGGHWVLSVSDHARRDVGALRSWTLRLGVGPAGRIRVRSATTVPIPDRDQGGVTSRLVVDRAGAVNDLSVDVDISHTYSGDLRLLLVAPDGREVLLRDRTGSSTDNVRERFTVESVPALGMLRQASAHGEWALRVADLIARDVGKLNGWGLDLSVG